LSDIKPTNVKSLTNISVVLDSIDAAVITIDPSGIILENNAASSRIFGYSSEELVGQNVSMLMPEPYRSEHDGYLHNHISTGHSSIIGVGRRVSGLRSDGHIFPLHLAVGKHVANGRTLFTGILHDLSNEVTQLEDRARLGQILNTTLNEIYLFDVDTFLFSTVSHGALVNLGYTRSEMLKMTPVDIKPEYTKARFVEIIAPLLSREKERIQFSTSHARKNATQYDVEVSLSICNGLEGKREFIAIIEDVTEKNKMLSVVQQSQRLESIGQLTGGIAHDFNNILTVVSGNLQILESSIDDADLAEVIKDAREASSMGARLTERLLAFASRNTLLPKTISVNKLITEMIELLRRSIGENIYLSTNLTPDLWLTSIDLSQLENSLINLSINARDAMSSGGTLTITTRNVSGKFNIETAEETQSGDYIRIDVSDTGSGIAKQDLPHIYEPFYTTKASSAGTGMGLSMVYGFVRQSKGFIEVESRVNEGTTFSLYLPRGKRQTEKLADEPAFIVAGESKKGRCILLVEDEERVRRLAKRQLERMGHTIIEAVDGHDALEKFNSDDRIDFVFSDMIMSVGMTGYDLAKEIRKLRPGFPILLTSGYANELLDLEKLSKEGIALIRKPYSEEDLQYQISETTG